MRFQDSIKAPTCVPARYDREGPIMRFCAILLVTVVTAPAVLADSPAVQFSRRFNELSQAVPSSIKSDGAGNAYFCGRVLGGTFPLLHPIQTSGSIFLTKLDPGC